jgi:hypothetical protein
MYIVVLKQRLEMRKGSALTEEGRREFPEIGPIFPFEGQ